MILSRAPLLLLLSPLACTLVRPEGPGDPTDPSRYDVVWDTPGPDANASVPLGNGSTGVNAWVEPDGSLVFYISRGDCWSENGRLLKLGRVRVRFEPPLDVASAFRQRLNLRDGALEVGCGEGNARALLLLWVDAHHPRIEIQCAGGTPRAAIAEIEPWRTEPTPYPRAEVSDLLEDRSHPNHLHQEVMVMPDHLLEGGADRIGWYHHNATSVGPRLIARLQGLDGYLEGRPDPLLHRTFGAIVTAAGGVRRDATTLRVPPNGMHRISVTVHSAWPATPEQWLAEAEERRQQIDRLDPAQRSREHARWWREFWARSWIHVRQRTPSGPVPRNDHPLRLGADQEGGNRFAGEIGRVEILARPLARQRIRELAEAPPVPAAALNPVVPEDLDWSFPRGLTITAWIRPGQLPPGGGRIADKITPGAGDGLLLDTYPSNGLRLIAGTLTLAAPDVLPAGEWTHVAAVLDPAGGRAELYVNGVAVARKSFEFLDDAAVVSRAYALQRYVNACAGRGPYPIKFNGSIFTVPAEGRFGDADYRRWGPGYWWQNTRLPYLGMCASGDFEMELPLFRMYADELLPLHVYRTRQYTGHGGAFIPECIDFWGPIFTSTYGWTPFAERGEDKLQESGWHKREWVSGLELVWMMLDWYEHTLDEDFARRTLLPTAREVLAFFDEHYADGPDGRMVMEPAQALETWWDCTDPMPEIAGLRAVTARLLALPPDLVDTAQRMDWARLQRRLPDLPTREVDGVRMLAPAARFAEKRNIENPELYAVFPFRLVTATRGNEALGIAALDARWDRGHSGWRQDDLFMTGLGLAEQARANLLARARQWHAGSRFPAFWGPNYDWVPDQDHGGVLVRTLQTMLLQTDGRQIHLLPAWPEDWDADFQLHAPYRTTIRGHVRGGRLVDLDVTPRGRRADVTPSR